MKIIFNKITISFILLCLSTNNLLAGENEGSELLSTKSGHNIPHVEKQLFSGEDFEKALNDIKLEKGSRWSQIIMAGMTGTTISCGPVSGYLAYQVVKKLGYDPAWQYIIAVPAGFTAVIRMAYPAQYFGNIITSSQLNPDSEFLESPIYRKTVYGRMFGEFLVGCLASVPLYYLNDDFVATLMSNNTSFASNSTSISHYASLPLNITSVIAGGFMLAGLIEIYKEKIPFLIDSLFEQRCMEKFISERRKLTSTLKHIENHILTMDDTSILELDNELNNYPETLNKLIYLSKLHLPNNYKSEFCNYLTNIPTGVGAISALVGGVSSMFNYNFGFESTKALEKLVGIDTYHIFPIAVGSVRVITMTALNIISCYDVFKKTTESILNLPSWICSKEFISPARLTTASISLVILALSVSTALPQVGLSIDYFQSNNTALSTANAVSNFIANYGVCYWSLSNLFHLCFGEFLPKDLNYLTLEKRREILDLIKSSRNLIHNLKNSYCESLYNHIFQENN